MSTEKMLDKEELSFLQSVLETGVSQGSFPHPQFVLDGDSSGKEMLSRLGSASMLHMIAHIDNHELVFPLELKQDEFGRLTMDLHQPLIYEKGPTIRQWRMQPKLPLRLLADSGEEVDLTVNDISLSGFSVSFEDASQAPDNIAFQLALPEADTPLKLHGKKARQIDQQRVAYQLIFDEQEQEKQLRRFLFQQHQQQFPDLELPKL